MTSRLATQRATAGEDPPNGIPSDAHHQAGASLRRLPKGVIAGLGLSLVVALVATAVVFSLANGTFDVAGFGSTGIHAEASLSGAAATRNRAVQAQLLSEAQDRGIVTAAEASESLNSTAAAAAELDRRTARLIDELGDEVAAAEIASRTSAFIYRREGPTSVFAITYPLAAPLHGSTINSDAPVV